MKRLISLAIAPLLILSICATPALAATPKAGTKCPTFGQSVIASGKKFTCLMLGSKQVWNKGVTEKTSTNTSPKSSNAAANLPLPITLPVPQNGAITFTNAVANFASIPKTSWQRVQDAIAANSEVSIPTVIHIGPNTKASSNAISTALGRINKLFAGFRHVSRYNAIVYNAQDQQWAQTDALELFMSQNIKGYSIRPDSIKNLVQAGCEINGTEVVNCGGGMAFDFRDGGSDAGGAYYGVQSDGDYWSDSTKNVGPMSQVNHEAMHNYQSQQFFFTPLGKGQNISADLMHAATPWWFSEGQANAIGVSTFLENFSDYSQVRNDLVTRSPGSRGTIPTFTIKGMKSFLNDPQVASPENNNWLLAYSVGFAAVEALVAIGGPQSTLAIYTLAAKGEDFQTAFKHVYGISWDEGSTILAEVLAAEYASLPMSTR